MVDVWSGDSSETVRRVQGPSRGNLLPEVRLDCRRTRFGTFGSDAQTGVGCMQWRSMGSMV